MNPTDPASSAEARDDRKGGSPRLTFAGGGWVIALAAIVCAALLAWSFIGVLSGSRPVGDGSDIESYGFDLSRLDVGEGVLTGSRNPRDLLFVLDDPPTLPGRDIAEINRRDRGKVLVSSDRVIGVTINGEARAYPVRLMNAHEIVNDTLAGVPIAVTYFGLTDSAVVFLRQAGDRILRFGISGLVLNSNLVMYDRDAETPSLWSQLEARAIAGPLSGTPLTIVPGVQVCTWSDWLTAHPDTTVLDRDPRSVRRYKDIDYRRYWSLGKPDFPVAPLPDERALAETGLTLMTPLVELSTPDARVVLTWPELEAKAVSAPMPVSVGDTIVLVTAHPDSQTITFDAEGPSADRLVVIPARLFGWYAARGAGTTLAERLGPRAEPAVGKSSASGAGSA